MGNPSCEAAPLFFFWSCVLRLGCCILQKDELAAKKAKQTEAEEAQKKIAEMMVKAQEQVRLHFVCYFPICAPHSVG